MTKTEIAQSLSISRAESLGEKIERLRELQQSTLEPLAHQMDDLRIELDNTRLMMQALPQGMVKQLSPILELARRNETRLDSLARMVSTADQRKERPERRSWTGMGWILLVATLVVMMTCGLLLLSSGHVDLDAQQQKLEQASKESEQAKAINQKWMRLYHALQPNARAWIDAWWETNE